VWHSPEAGRGEANADHRIQFPPERAPQTEQHLYITSAYTQPHPALPSQSSIPTFLYPASFWKEKREQGTFKKRDTDLIQSLNSYFTGHLPSLTSPNSRVTPRDVIFHRQLVGSFFVLSEDKGSKAK
jgi:hypothetical protein